MNKSHTSLYLSCDDLSKENAILAIKELKETIAFLTPLCNKLLSRKERDYNSVSSMNLINRKMDLHLWLRDILIKKMFYLDVIQIMSGIE